MKTYPLAYRNQQHQLKLQPKLKQQCRKGLAQQCQQQNVKNGQHHKVCKEETDVALVVGRAAWWIPVLAANTNMRNLTFAEALRDFLQNVSFHCYGKLVETGRRYQEKLFWLVFHIAALSTLIVFLWRYPNSGDQLLKTSLHDAFYPIEKVSFPAVSICSINRISNASAARYAEELNRKDPNNRGVKYFYELIKMLRYNYYAPNGKRDFHKALQFQKFLDYFDREDSELFYQTRNRMAMLTPNCTDILQKCYLGGKELDCAKEFAETFTSWGLCCTFNNKLSEGRSFRRQYPGTNMGLTLLLNAPQKDNFWKAFNLDGFIVNIQSPSVYSEPISGGVEENFALTGSDSYFGLTAQVYKTVEEARIYNAKVRNCLFDDELPKIFGSGYNFNNCITLCRLRSAFVLCGCYPFQTPFLNESTLTDGLVCSLQHIHCLARYDFKWFNVISQKLHTHILGLEREMEDSLYCPDCLPSCSETRYQVQVADLPLNEHILHSFPNYQENYSDLALLRIYFKSTNAIYYKRVLANSWFEVFSQVGNICGVIAGFSLIGVCEVLFFCIKQFMRAYKKELLCDDKVTSDRTLQILP